MKLKIFYRDMLIGMLGLLLAGTSLGLMLLLSSWALPASARASAIYPLGVLALGTWILLWSTRRIALKFAARCPHCGGLVTWHSRDPFVRKSATQTYQCTSCGSLLY